MRTNKANLYDLFLLCGAALVAVLFFMGRWRGIDYNPFLSGDSANSASFVLANLHPDLFTNDALLADPDNYAVWKVFHAWWIDAFYRYVRQDVSLALLSLIIPTVFLHITGYYWLGLRLTHSRLLATLMSAALCCVFQISLGEYWGLFQEPESRMLYQAVLPFLFLLAIKWLEQPSYWWLLMLMFGVITYIHPASGTPVAFGIWCALALNKPSVASRQQHALLMMALGLLYIATLIPFVLMAGPGTAGGEGIVPPYDLVMEAARARYIPGTFDLGVALENLVRDWYGPQALLWPLAFAASVIIWRRASSQQHIFLFFAAMAGGILFVAVGITWLEHSVLAALRHYPFEVDFIRAVRYLIMLAIVLVFWACSYLDYRLSYFAASLATVSWLLVADLPKWPIQAAYCVYKGWGYCPNTPDEQATVDFISFVREHTSPGDAFLDTHRRLSLRYAGQRSLVFSYKDGGLFGFGNHAALLAWYQDWKDYRHILKSPDNSLKVDAYESFARRMNADYFIVESELAPFIGKRQVIYQNGAAILMPVAQKHPVLPENP